MLKMVCFGRESTFYFCAIFPLLKLLHPTDSNKLNMDKVYFLVQTACSHLEKIKKFLMDKTLFPCCT